MCADATSAIADLSALEYLTLLDGSYTEHGLWQLTRLTKLRHLHIEREGLTTRCSSSPLPCQHSPSWMA